MNSRLNNFFVNFAKFIESFMLSAATTFLMFVILYLESPGLILSGCNPY